eukprot:scaffold69595_cov72-Phaeocystis_antarctica.AAC.1
MGPRAVRGESRVPRLHLRGLHVADHAVIVEEAHTQPVGLGRRGVSLVAAHHRGPPAGAPACGRPDGRAALQQLYPVWVAARAVDRQHDRP